MYINTHIEEFDRNDPANIGRPTYWSLNDHIKAVVQMICADEIEIAFDMLDRIPAWYRENYPKELTEIKNILYQQLYDSYEYSNESALEAGWNYDKLIEQYKNNYYYPRANILADEIKKYNDMGITPWICELSPSHGGMALGLLKDGLKFTYYAQNLNAKATDVLNEWMQEGVWSSRPLDNQPKILVAFECLEHSYRERDLEQAAKKIRNDYDSIFISVPFGCLFGGLANWSTRKLGHIRGYNTKDFYDYATKAFPEYKWTYYKAHSQVLVGKK